MKNRIYTYADLMHIEDNSWFAELKDYPQITVSTDLRKGLNWKSNAYRYKAVDFRQVQQHIVPSWATDSTKFQETVILSQHIRERIFQAEDEAEKKWLTGCRRNLSSILSAIIMLEEADVTPDDLVPKDKNLEFFIELWNVLIKRDPEIKDFRKKIADFDTPEKTDKFMEEMFGKNHDRKIVIHGFYYFTPIQQRILDAFEHQGYQLIYLFPFDERYRVANEIWLRTYADGDVEADLSSWNMGKPVEESALGALLEGKPAVNPGNLKVYQYKSILEYVNDMKRARNEGFSIYSSNHKKANEILKDFFPEEYGERKLLSYPVAQFIFTLNLMWDEDEQTIIFDEDSLRQCFSSGWLFTGEVSGKAYTKDLEYILPFFEKCRTVREWNDRIELLENIEERAIEPFKRKMTEDSGADERWQEVYNNPFNSFSMFAVPKERLNNVLELISRLIDIAEELFTTDGEIVLGDHIRKLDRLLKKDKDIKDIYSEERTIINELFNKFDKTKNSRVKCFPSDVALALNLLLEGAYEDEETRAYGVGMVYPMYQVDAARIKNGSKIHICLCDIKSMPGGIKKYVWPLTEKCVKDAFNRTKNKYLGIIITLMEEMPVSNRYLLYSALKNKEVELSWVKNMNGKLLAPSPYVQILNTLAGVKISEAKENNLSYADIEDIKMARKEITAYDFNRDKGHIAKEARMDYAICPVRYVYGYVLDRYPSYQTTFLHNYAVNGLITAVYYLMRDMGVSVKDIAEQVLGLFPNLRKIEKRQIADYLVIEAEDKNTDLGMTSEYCDAAYTDERLKVKFPYKEIREIAKEKYGELLTPAGRKGLNLHERTDVRRACVFCPHAEYCNNAIFVLDQEDVYD